MSEHMHREVVAGCYRCDLGRDEEVSGLAEEYFEEYIEPTMRGAGTPDDAIRSMQLRYISDILRNPDAQRELYEWAESRP